MHLTIAWQRNIPLSLNNSYNPISTDYSMEALKIAATCVVAAVLYGIVRPIHGTNPYRVLHCFSPANLSHSVPNPAGCRLENRSHVVGRCIFRCADDSRSKGGASHSAASI